MIHLIENLKDRFSLRDLCKLFEVARSTIYDRRKRSDKAEDKDLKLIEAIIESCLEEKAYGYRRITEMVKHKDFEVDRKKVYAIMKELGLLRKKRKKWIKTTDSNHSNAVFPNLAPKLDVRGTNQLWVGDITFVSIGKRKFVYVAMIMDVFSRKILGWSTSTNIDTQLYLNALNQALKVRAGESLEALVHHTDQGTQYTSKEYRAALADNNIIGSMSRKGNPYDNAFAESLFKTLKSEWLDWHAPSSCLEVHLLVDTFVKKYNGKRLHSSIGYCPPGRYEEQIERNRDQSIAF